MHVSKHPMGQRLKFRRWNQTPHKTIWVRGKSEDENRLEENRLVRAFSAAKRRLARRKRYHLSLFSCRDYIVSLDSRMGPLHLALISVFFLNNAMASGVHLIREQNPLPKYQAWSWTSTSSPQPLLSFGFIKHAWMTLSANKQALGKPLPM
jgi:hypothetical protein